MTNKQGKLSPIEQFYEDLAIQQAEEARIASSYFSNCFKRLYIP